MHTVKSISKEWNWNTKGMIHTRLYFRTHLCHWKMQGVLLQEKSRENKDASYCNITGNLLQKFIFLRFPNCIIDGFFIVQFISFPMIPNLYLWLIFFYAKRSFVFPLPLTFASQKIQNGGQKNGWTTHMGHFLEWGQRKFCSHTPQG